MSTATPFAPPAGTMPTRQQIDHLILHETMANQPLPPPPIPKVLYETMQVSPEVAKLFLNILRPQPQTQLYINRLDHCYPVVAEFVKQRLRVGALNTPLLNERTCHSLNDTIEKDDRHFRRVETSNPEFYKPEDKYHYAFGVYPFLADLDPNKVKRPTDPLYREDSLSQWQCSKYIDPKRKATDNIRKAALHLMGLEGLMSACVVGGYFGAVLPKRWIGREQSYLRWWQNKAAIVARIELPKSWVTVDTAYKLLDGSEIREKIDMPGDWELVIWQRAGLFDKTTDESKAHAHLTSSWVVMRWPQFVTKLEADENANPDFPQENWDKEILNLVRNFQASEWWNFSVKFFNDLVENHSTNRHYGNFALRPHILPEADNTLVLKPTPKNQYHIRVLPDIRHIKGLKNKLGQWMIKPPANAAHLTVTNKIKLRAYGEQGLVAAGLLLDARYEDGVGSADGERFFHFDNFLRKRNFAEYKEELLERLEQRGLVPCMTQADFDRVLHREKWLSLQLTPVERWIPVQKAKTSDELSSDERSWELIYEDIGLEATYPEIVAQWMARAKKIGLNKTGVTFGFQFKDIVVMAIKESILNGNVMGLGKTRETLFAMILKGGSRFLIICPSKLIGVWQDEIRDTIAPFMNRQRKNWNGKTFKCTLQIIKNAENLKKENLKTFNIISYDTLKSVPKDSQFYKCPKCGVVVCKKHRSDYVPTCPGNEAMPEHERCSHAIKQWKATNKQMGWRKRHFLMDGPATDPTSQVLFEINPKAVARRKFPQENIKTLDDRPPRPKVQAMEEVPNMHKKMKAVRNGWEVIKDEFGNITDQRKPRYDWIERKVGQAAIHVKWTFAELLRHRFNHACADEAQYASNEDAQRTVALMHTRTIKRKMALTGTPVKGYPKKIIPVLNWAFPRSLFPDYQLYDPDGEMNFLRKYQTEVDVQRDATWVDEDAKDDADAVKGKKKKSEVADAKLVRTRKTAAGSTERKIVPKINNPELFQAELAPVMVRHLRTEPGVVIDIPRKIVVSLDHPVTMDPDHKEYCELWIESFAEWFRLKKKEVDNKDVGDGPLIAKLQYLYSADTNPWFMLDGIEKTKDETAKAWANKIGRYEDFLKRKYAKLGKKPPNRPTAKFLRLRELLVEAIKAGDKSLVGCTRRANLALGVRWCEQSKIGCVKIDGTVPLDIPTGESRSKRHALVDSFRYDPQYRIAWCGLEAMAEGMNVPEANHGFINDYYWDPTPIRQFIGRMIRPAQTKTIYAHYLFHRGTISEYMAALCYLKSRSGDEGIDYMPFSEFSGALVPDIHQYAQAIVDGTHKVMAAKMWAAVDYIKKKGTDDDEGGLYGGG